MNHGYQKSWEFIRKRQDHHNATLCFYCYNGLPKTGGDIILILLYNAYILCIILKLNNLSLCLFNLHYIYEPCPKSSTQNGFGPVTCYSIDSIDANEQIHE